MGASNQGQARTQACLPGSQKPVHRELTPQAQPGLATLPHSLLRMVVQLGRKPSGPDSRLPQRRSRRGPISQLLSLLKIFTSKYVPVCHASAPSQPGRLSSPPARHGAASAAASSSAKPRANENPGLAGRHPPCKSLCPGAFAPAPGVAPSSFPQSMCSSQGSHGAAGSCHLSKKPFLHNAVSNLSGHSPRHFLCSRPAPCCFIN